MIHDDKGKSVKRRGLLPLLAVVFGVAAAMAMLPVTTPASAQNLQVSLGKGTVTPATVRPGATLTIMTNIPFVDLVIGDSAVADVVPLSDRSLYIQGKRPGFTNISIFDANNRILGIINVKVALNFEDVQSAINSAVPNNRIRVSNAGDRIRLSGSVGNATDLERATSVAQQYSDQPVINALAVGGSQQVALEVRVLEAKRNAGRELGVNMRVSGGSSLFGSGPRLTINADPDTARATTYLTDNKGGNQTDIPFGTLVGNVLSTAGVNIDLIIDALEKKGAVRRLAQPNLTTISGETAKFHAGGEVPIQTSISSGSGVGTSTDYRPYGVRLEFLPTVLEASQVNLRILTEVSELDRSVVVNGNPGFTSRKAETVVELRDGQSYAMAGLLQVVNSRDIQQLPWLGQLPVLGPLFRSTSFQKEETDLVIVITPRLVRPSSPDEKLYSPLDQTLPSNDVELFALGLLEVDKDMIKKYREGEGIIGPYGHRLDLEFEDVNVAKK